VIMKTKSFLLVAAAVITISFGGGLAMGHGNEHGALQVAQAAESAQKSDALTHVESKFTFTLHAPMAVAAPLFGPEGERSWGGADWDPSFLYPQPAKDVEGAVFVVRHGERKSTWVVTALDFTAGHVQYVSLIDGALATRIDIHLTPQGPENTSVTVVYERTAMRQELNDHVKTLAKDDADSAAAHWESTINGYLKSKSQNTH